MPNSNCPYCMKRHRLFPNKCVIEVEKDHRLLCVLKYDGPIIHKHHPNCKIMQMYDWLWARFRYDRDTNIAI